MGNSSKISPFAPATTPALPAISGVRLAACEAGIKYANRKDLLLVDLVEGTTVAGVLTTSKTASAAVDACRSHLPGGRARGLVVNSGNSNAFTGQRGKDAVTRTVDICADVVGCAPGDVFVASTGVIGEPLSTEGFEAKLASLAADLSPNSWNDAAAAIMTTDTYPKAATRSVQIDGHTLTINGIAKGSGMIAPDMATMLAFVFTDANIDADALQTLTQKHVASTFNSVTVDSDTSTSDTLLCFATGQTEAARITSDTPDTLAQFGAALHAVLEDLALQVVKDGEGISKFVTINVTGAQTDAAASVIARSIANSPLVKTAIAGEDPNWGRVVMAVGKSGEAADRDKLEIRFGDVLVAENGEVADDYTEEVGAAYMKNSDIVITADIGLGAGSARVWTCDLTHDYISINADYRS